MEKVTKELIGVYNRIEKILEILKLQSGQINILKARIGELEEKIEKLESITACCEE